MAPATPGTTGKLEVRRTIAAPRERVFEAFARQEQMDRWMCRDAATHVIKYLQFDFRVGGGFMLDIRTPGGDIYIHRSTYTEIKRPEKIAFTWNLELTDKAGHKSNAPSQRHDRHRGIVGTRKIDRGSAHSRSRRDLREGARRLPARLDRMPGKTCRSCGEVGISENSQSRP